jgi:hypothetical protein
VKKINLEILMDLHVLRLSEYGEMVFGNAVSLPLSACLCLHVGMYASLVPAQLDGCYLHSVLKSLSVTDQCPTNINILAPRIRPVQMSPRTQSGNIPENGSNDFD